MELQDTNATPEETMEGSDFLEGLGTQEETEDTNPEESATGDESEEEQTSEEAEEAPQEEQAKPAEEETQDGIEITYLGEKMTVKREDAPALIQKGMNYDHVQEKVARLEAELKAPRAETQIVAEMNRYAKANNATLEQLIKQMKAFSDERNVPMQNRKETDYFKEKAVSDWKDFMKAYPDINDPKTQLPREVWQAINSGLTPRQALIEYNAAKHEEAIKAKDAEIEALKTELQTIKQNQQNKEKTPGSAASSAGSKQKDSFLAGLGEGW